MDVVALGRQGGKARARRLSPEQRSESARKAAAARWAGHVAKRPASSRKKQSKKRGKKAGVKAEAK